MVQIIGPEANVLSLLTQSLKKITSEPKTECAPVVIGGQVGNVVNSTCWKLAKGNRLVELCKIQSGEFGLCHSICQVLLGFAVTGGFNSDLCMMFIIATMSWQKLPRLLTKRCSHGSICVKGVIYVLGGKPWGGKSTSVDFLPTDGGQWQKGPDLSVAVNDPKVAELNGAVYLLDENTNQLFELNTEQSKWIKRAPIPLRFTDCSGTSMISVNGQLCVAGGQHRICAFYVPEFDIWIHGNRPSYCHIYGALVPYNNKLLLLGGSSKFLFMTFGTNEVEEYDINGRSWSGSKIKMPADTNLLHRHHAFILDVPHSNE